MNFIRRIILILSISALIVAIVFGVLWLKTESFSNSDPGNLIPKSFIVCLKTDQFSNLDQSLRIKGEIWKDLKADNEYTRFQDFDKFLVYFDSLRNAHIELASLFEQDVYISSHKKNGQFEFLVSLASNGTHTAEELMILFDSTSQITKSKYENQNYYQIIYGEGNFIPELFFYEYKGAIAISSSIELLKESIRTETELIKTFQGSAYKRIIETAGKDVPANIYLNFEEISKLTADILIKDLEVPLKTIFTASVLDLEAYPEKLILNGFTSFENSKSSNYIGFENPSLNEKQLYKLFPSSIVSFKEIEAQRKGLSRVDAGDSEKLFLSRFEELTGTNSAELTCKRSGEYCKYLFVNLISGGNMWNYLTTDAKELLGANYNPDIKEFRIGEKVFSYANTDSNRIPEIAGLGNKLIYNSFIVYDNVLIFAENREAILYVITQNELGNTLSNDRSFKSLEENFSSNFNVFSFINPSEYLDLLSTNLKPQAKSFLSETKKSWSKFNGLSFQSTRADSLHYFRVFLNYSGVRDEMVNTVWKRKLDSLSVLKPAIVKNYINNDKQILVQDMFRNVYLLGTSGDILWKTKCDGPILSEIKQVDYYNNGKLQYLFNTAKRLYLIDRNGNPVDKFPIEFISDASSGISLFDYDNNGDWRISVPLNNKQIAMYDRSGKLVSGWKFRKSDHIVNKALKYTRIGDKDFLLARDPYKLYFLDRKGKERMKPERQIHFSDKNPIFIDKSEGKGNEKVIVSDENGSVFYFYFNKKVKKVLENNLSSDHFFLAEDIIGNSKKEFIFTNKNELLVYDSDKKLLFSKQLPEDIVIRPVVYEFSAKDKKIGLVATKTGKIYLYNSDGTQYEGFPLNGSSLFSISSFPGLKDRFNLIVSNKDNFLYNYSVK